MARPLRFDDQFASAINDQIDEKFLNFIRIKVPKTAFYKNLSLQSSLIIASSIDLFLGVIVFLYFFEILDNKEESLVFFFENIFFIFGMFFGILGIDSAINLKKTNSFIYKFWRIFITFSIVSIETYQMIIDSFCFFTKECKPLYFTSCIISFVLINVYLIKIAWGFCIRLDKNQVLLIIHGKHLEKMLSEDNYIIKDYNKFIPNEMKISNLRNYYQEKELINIASGNMSSIDEEVFAPKKKNPFLEAQNKSKNML